MILVELPYRVIMSIAYHEVKWFLSAAVFLGSWLPHRHRALSRNCTLMLGFNFLSYDMIHVFLGAESFSKYLDSVTHVTCQFLKMVMNGMSSIHMFCVHHHMSCFRTFNSLQIPIITILLLRVHFSAKILGGLLMSVQERS